MPSTSAGKSKPKSLAVWWGEGERGSASTVEAMKKEEDLDVRGWAAWALGLIEERAATVILH